MGTFLRFASTLTLVVGVQLIASGNALALTGSASASAVVHETTAVPSKPSADLKDDTYHPPDNGGPDSTQGSGTR
jgi:hypothetical protein